MKLLFMVQLTEEREELKYLLYLKSYDCFCGYNCCRGTYFSASLDRVEYVRHTLDTSTHTHTHLNTVIALYLIYIFYAGIK